MAVVIETTLGDITVDLFLKQRPVTCLNFLKLCKMKYYNYNLFHSIRSGFIAQTGDPTGEGTGGESIFGLLEGPDKRFFSGEKMPKIRHTDVGLLSMVGTGEVMVGSQFFFTLGSDLDSLDGVHCVIGEVTEGHEVLRKLNEVICDETHRPYQDVRITHTVVLEDPFNDPVGLQAPSRSPSPSADRLRGGRIAPDEDIDETQGRSAAEIQEMIEDKEAKARATILEIVGDIPDADIAPPENVLFVCKLNPVTTDEDLDIIFSRFGKIVNCEVIRDKKTGDSLQYAFIEFADKKSCEDAYFKMDNVLIDDRRIHVDFSQSVSKVRYLGKGRIVKENNKDLTSKDFDTSRKDRTKRPRSQDRDNNISSRDRDRKYDKSSRGNVGHDNERPSERKDEYEKARHKERSRSREKITRNEIDNKKRNERSRSREKNARNEKKYERCKERSKSREKVDDVRLKDKRASGHRVGRNDNNDSYLDSKNRNSDRRKDRDDRKSEKVKVRNHDSHQHLSQNIDDSFESPVKSVSKSKEDCDSEQKKYSDKKNSRHVENKNRYSDKQKLGEIKNSKTNRDNYKDSLSHYDNKNSHSEDLKTKNSHGDRSKHPKLSTNDADFNVKHGEDKKIQKREVEIDNKNIRHSNKSHEDEAGQNSSKNSKEYNKHSENKKPSKNFEVNLSKKPRDESKTDKQVVESKNDEKRTDKKRKTDDSEFIKPKKVKLDKVPSKTTSKKSKEAISTGKVRNKKGEEKLNNSKNKKKQRKSSTSTSDSSDSSDSSSTISSSSTDSEPKRKKKVTRKKKRAPSSSSSSSSSSSTTDSSSSDSSSDSSSSSTDSDSGREKKRRKVVSSRKGSKKMRKK